LYSLNSHNWKLDNNSWRTCDRSRFRKGVHNCNFIFLSQVELKIIFGCSSVKCAVLVIIIGTTNIIPVSLATLSLLLCIVPFKNSVFDTVDCYLWDRFFACELHISIRNTTTILFSVLCFLTLEY
jgi:hypothetical protein